MPIVNETNNDHRQPNTMTHHALMKPSHESQQSLRAADHLLLRNHIFVWNIPIGECDPDAGDAPTQKENQIDMTSTDYGMDQV